MRVCSDCKRNKPLAEYHRAKAFPLGRGYRCKQCVSEYNRKLKSRPEYLARKAKEARQYHARNRAKRNARAKLRYAVSVGKVARQNCFCGQPAQAHHADYDKPYEVTWLCRTHHLAEHSE